MKITKVQISRWLLILNGLLLLVLGLVIMRNGFEADEDIKWFFYSAGNTLLIATFFFAFAQLFSRSRNMTIYAIVFTVVTMMFDVPGLFGPPINLFLTILQALAAISLLPYFLENHKANKGY